MNPDITRLNPYPFAKLRTLFEGLEPNSKLRHITLGIGEPTHAPHAEAVTALADSLDTIGRYPSIIGELSLRQAISDWACTRFRLNELRPTDQILPVSGTREGLFSIAQAVCSSRQSSHVFAPNPFYQIYEGAALMAGAELVLLPCLASTAHQPDYMAVSDAQWSQCTMLYICNPGNPSGGLLAAETLAYLINKAIRFDFVIVADECYSEIYRDESTPPIGLLQACAQIGHHSYQQCLIFHSLSKRSNLPGLRSGFVAGDAGILSNYLKYRTYHGSAMPLHHQRASTVAWADEQHVIANRAEYRDKFQAVLSVLQSHYTLEHPEGGFYIWLPTPIDDEEFALRLYRDYSLTVLPGTYLGRSVNGTNPGKGYVRLALVAAHQDCIEAAHRIIALTQSITTRNG
ncbi:MAG: succinyldiaminopimelate transaminase [Proteobacteria bacterium]|jgi:N-succinyldiaminopimelate aminotransferase|nr:succinyldiaminopimelate transaminase [Pseudomonadota bacterium]